MLRLVDAMYAPWGILRLLLNFYRLNIPHGTPPRICGCRVRPPGYNFLSSVLQFNIPRGTPPGGMLMPCACPPGMLPPFSIIYGQNERKDKPVGVSIVLVSFNSGVLIVNAHPLILIFKARVPLGAILSSASNASQNSSVSVLL